MATRRTTLAADPDDLALLQREARRQGMSLARLLREIVAKEADELRARRRPRFGLFSGGGRSLAELSWRDEDSPVQRGSE